MTFAIDSASWARFAHYAPRIRVFQFTSSDNRSMQEVYRLLVDVAIRRRTSTLLPNLRSLRWLAGPKFLPLFATATVQDFSFRIDWPKEKYPYHQFALDILQSMPRITSLACDWVHGKEHGLGSLLSLLQGYQGLTEITLPAERLNDQALTELSKLADLRTISFEYTLNEHRFCRGNQFESISDAHEYSFALEPGAFPSLINLSVYLRLSDAERLLTHPNLDASRLRKLFFISVATLPAPVMQEFCRMLAARCKSLTSLILSFQWALEEGGSDFHDHDHENPLTAVAIKPLLAIRSLTTLHLAQALPLTLDDDDLLTIVRSLPLLEDLSLNFRPAVLIPPNLTMGALPICAEHCPRLRELSLYMNTERFPSFRLTHAFSPTLETLRIGPSELKPVSCIRVALFLSRLLARETKVLMGQDVDDPEDPMDIDEEEWDNVKNLVTGMIHARMDEREGNSRDLSTIS